MDSDPYSMSQPRGGASSQGPQHQQQQSTLNSLLSTPSSFAPSFNQMYTGHPMQHQQQQSFDGQGYGAMQYGQPMQGGMHAAMQQHRGGPFSHQLPGPPGNHRMGPTGMPMMRMESDKAQNDWMAFQQQQQHMQHQQQPVPSYNNAHMMNQQSSVGMLGQQFPGGSSAGPPPPSMDMGAMDDGAPAPKPKSKKSKSKRSNSTASASPTPPAARASAQQLQQQVLQHPPHMMAQPEPEPPKKPSKKKKKKAEPAPPPDLPATSMDGPGQGMDPSDRGGYPPPPFFQQQQQFPPHQQHHQRPPFPHGPPQFAPQAQHGAPPVWADRAPMIPPWMQQQQQQQQQHLPSNSHMGMPQGGMGGGMPTVFGHGGPPAGPSQGELGQQSMITEPVSHTPSPSHSSSSSQNVYNQNREFPFASDMPLVPPVKAKKTKSHKAGAAAAERAERAEREREETAAAATADLPWTSNNPTPPAASSGTGKSAMEKLALMYEMGNEPDRRPVLDNIIKCSEENGVPIVNIPVIAKVSLDLYKLYKIIQSRGGYIEVHRSKGWKEVAAVMGIISPNPNTAYTLKKQYVKFVLPYEARFDRGGVTAEAIMEAADAAPPTKSPGRNRANESKKRSRTSVTAVEQLSGSNDGLDGLPGPSPSQLQGQYPSGPPQNSNFSARGGGGPPQFSGGPQEGPQQYGYPPQSYGGAPQSEMGGQPGVPAYWTGPGGASAPGIPFEGRGLQGELGDRGEDGMSQHRGPGQHGAARPPPMGQGYPGMERNENIQGGMNGLRGLVAGVGQDAALHERRPHDGASGQPNFMTAPSPSPMSQPPFSDRHSSIPAPQTMMHGQNSIAANGAARMHAGKDHRMMMPLGQGQVGGEAHSRQHRMLGGMPFQLQPPMTQPPPPVQDFYNFPAGSVEATEIVLRNRSRMTAREASGGTPVDVWKLHMRMRSGLMAESGWAFEMLNIYTCDDQLCGQFLLANLPAGFLDTISDWFQVAMYRLIESRRTTAAAKPLENGIRLNETKPVIDAGSWERDCAENSYLRTHLDYPPWGDCEGRDKAQESIPDMVDLNGGMPSNPVGGDQGTDHNARENSSSNKPLTDQPVSVVPFFLNLTSESEDDIGRKCVAISTSLRNLSAIHGNEVHFGKNQRLLSLIGRFITLSHSHLTEDTFGSKPVVENGAIADADADLSSASLFSASFGDSETTSVTNVTNGDLTHVEETPVVPVPPVPWWQGVMEHVRENLLVCLANISGYMDLSECDETVCRPILEGLIHWTTCPSSMAQEVLPTVVSQRQGGELSAKCLALEAISKLTVTDANIDLLIAAPSATELSHFIDELIQLLPCPTPWTATAHLLREFAMVILCSLVTCEERVCHIVAEHAFGLEYLTMLLEEFDREFEKMAQLNLKYDSHEGPIPTPNSAFSAMMLRKTIEILLTMAELPAVRTILAKFQLRFWNLIVEYRFPDTTALTGLTKILFLLSASEAAVTA